MAKINSGMFASGDAPSASEPEPPKSPQPEPVDVKPSPAPSSAKPSVIDGARDEYDGRPAKAEAEPPLRHPWQVAPGRAIVCMRGVLGPGAEVRPEYLHPKGKEGVTGDAKKDLAEGQTVLDGLIKRGDVIKGRG